MSHPGITAQLTRRRTAAAAAWDLTDELVLVGAGGTIEIPGRGDVTYPYCAHSEYFYLTDRNRPNGVLAFDPADGWADFVEPVSVEERLWSGASEDEPEGVPLSELEGWLRKRAGRPVAALGVPAAAEVDATLTSELRLRLSEIRRVKDPVELERMRAAERATRDGFAAIVPLIQEGATERGLQVELEAGFLRAGATAIAFDTIVAGGPNSAVLHFAPTSRPLQRGELLLVDAGGEYLGYASDVTRTYPVGGQLTAEQRELHALVRAAGLAAMDRCTAGTEFRELHRTAARVIAEGLVGFGLLRGDPDALVERGAVALFFPHGIGHMVGIGVRDAGGSIGRPVRDEFPRLRADLPLRSGHTITIEPGVYFVPALLLDPERRAKHREAVDWALADRMLGFGGIRIEDNVHVKDDTFEVLTADVPLLS